jgi:hypothetical protein
MIPAGIALPAFGVALSATGYPGEDPVSGALKGLGAMLFRPRPQRRDAVLSAASRVGAMGGEALCQGVQGGRPPRGILCLGSRQGPGDVPLYRRAITSAS